MIKRCIGGIILSIVIVLLPTLGNIKMIQTVHIWIIILLGILASIFQPAYNPFTITNKPKDKGTGAQIIWSVYLTQCAAIFEASYFQYPDQGIPWDLVSTLALITALLGLGLRSWAVLTLGSFFTMHIDIHPDHQLVQKGPYTIVRHPSYLGAFILYTSTLIFLHAWVSVSIGTLILLLAFIRRIRYEEEFLRAEFGADYQKYSARVKRLVPGLW